MKTFAITAYGGPDVLQIVERAVPVPSPGEVLVKVVACGVNPADGKWRQGMFRDILPLNLPHVPGYDFAGTVESGTADLPSGTRVFAMLDNLKAGAYAEYVVAPAGDVARIPPALDDIRAAALPTAALTGLQMIEEYVRPAAGEVILITGALGAVGRFALHAAKARGAKVIAAVRASQAAEALAIGADGVQVIGAPVQNGLQFAHVADTVGGSDVAALCRYVLPGGRIATVSTTPIAPDGLPVVPQFITVHIDAAMLERIARLVVSGQVAYPVARVLPFSQTVAAHRLLDAGGSSGKIVLRVDRSDGMEE